MSEATIDTRTEAQADTTATLEAERKADNARLKKMSALHFTAAMAALTLWGAADAWAATSGWALAQAVAIANAFIAATVVASIAHEWGHFAGARLANAKSPVHAKPVNYFFMFDFPFDANDTRQFLWMSWGGILAPWVVVVATLVLVPIDSVSRLTLLAALAAKAAAASLFEVPIVLRTRVSGEPQAELVKEVTSGGLATSTKLSWAVGAAVWLVIWVVI